MLRFDQDAPLNQADFKLFQVTQDVLDQLIDTTTHKKNHPAIKGLKADQAVLTTTDQSFTLRLAASSNSHLLIPQPPHDTTENLPHELGIVACLDEHFELVQTAPNLGRILQLVSAQPYSAQEAASASFNQNSRPTFEHLELAGQCSRQELRVALQRHRALEVSGRWCRLEPQLELDACVSLLHLVVEKGLHLDSVPVGECVRELTGQYPEIVVRHCLRCLSTSATASPDEWESSLNSYEIELNPRALSRLCAQKMFDETSTWPILEFMEAWQDNLPSGIETNRSDLDGLAIETDEDRLRALDVSTLPHDPASRFAVLFNVKSRWAMEELRPYMVELLPPGKTVEHLVLRHARSVLDKDGSRYCVARC